MVGETNRAPFDLPEAEGELVGGFNTEYSSLKFAMFMLAEYINMVTVSAVASTMFLGGWRAPWPITAFWAGANHGWWPMLWFVIKVQLLLFFFIWLRGTLPRLRYDQFMKLGWKVLIPVSLVWLVLVATVRTLRNRGTQYTDLVLVSVGAILAVVLLSIVWDTLRNRRAPDADPAGAGVRPHGRRVPGAAAARAAAAAHAAPAAPGSRSPSPQPTFPH